MQFEDIKIVADFFGTGDLYLDAYYDKASDSIRVLVCAKYGTKEQRVYELGVTWEYLKAKAGIRL